MDRLRQDVRFALRSARRAPGFVCIAVVTLAIGIGASTATFSVANGILLRPLPIREQDRVIVMWAKQRDFDHVPVRWTEVDRYARETRAFERVGGVDYNGAWSFAMSDRGEPVPVRSAWVTGDFFEVLGAVPQIGRLIERRDDVVNAPFVAVISDGLWRRRYGGDANVLGRTLVYDDRQVTIVGVAPRGFEYPEGAELWGAVLSIYPAARTDTAPGSLDVVGRLRADATMEQGRRELDTFLEGAYAKWRGPIGRFEATARTFSDVVVGGVEPAVLTLSAAAALVLLVACMNVANLLLVRGVMRVREVAIRASLGAARARIVRQLVTESGLLGCAGAAFGVGIAALAVRLLVRLAPPEVPRLAEVVIDGRAMAFASVMAVVAVLVFGIGPAFALTGGELGLLMRRAESRGTTSSRGSVRAKQAVLVVQAALAVLVLAAAGLLIRSYANLNGLNLGFHRERVVIAQLTMPWSRFNTPDGMDRFTLLLEQLQEATRAIPGVTGVAMAATPPFSGTGGWDALPTVDGQTAEERARQPWVNMEIVTTGYFETLGVHIVRGRRFAPSDRKGAPTVAVVNQSMARQYWPNGDALGKRLWLGAPSDSGSRDPGRWRYTVVGVVGDMRYRDLRTARPSFYLPSGQYSRTAPTWFIVRSAVAPEALVRSLRRAFAGVDASASILTARTMDDYLNGPLARPRFSATLLATFGAIALLLVAVGIYGVIGEQARQARRELGIRLALGARSRDVAWMVLRTALRPVTLGVALGAVIAIAGARTIEQQLYGVTATDPATMIAVAMVVVATTVGACIVPARFAARLNPVDVLRDD